MICLYCWENPSGFRVIEDIFQVDFLEAYFDTYKKSLLLFFQFFWDGVGIFLQFFDYLRYYKTVLFF